MYPPWPYSTPSELAEPISATATQIPVADISAFPPAPNIAVIRDDDENAETILYTLKIGNALSGVTRAYEDGDVARSWDTGVTIATDIAALVIAAMQGNIEIAHSDADKPPVGATQAGLMTPAMYLKLLGIEPGALNNPHPSTHPAAMIDESTTRRFVSDEWLATVNDFLAGGGGVSLLQIIEDLAHLTFQLAVNGLIDAEGMGSVIVDVFDTPDSVILESGQFANGRVFI